MKEKTGQKMRIFQQIVAFLIPLLVGGFSALLTAEDRKIYETVNRPPLAPPGWLFFVVWTVLYVLMGLASYYVYASDAAPERKRRALLLYGVQLAMNLFWCTLFFTYMQYLPALIWLLVMWILILICTVRFYQIRRAAGVMMGALFLWTTFAAYLNLAWYVMSVTPMPLAA